MQKISRRPASLVRPLLIACALLLGWHPALLLAQFNIVIVPGAGLASNPEALAAFNSAAASWSSRFSDPITVTINADLSTTGPGGGPFGPNTIGSTSSVSLSGGYNLIRNAMVTDSTGQPNSAIVASLPTAAQFTANLPAGRTLSGNIALTKADAKALGFTGLDATFGASDGTIVFNSAFAFDYNRANGLTPGQVDFQTVAIHEIGHALGFTSTVDSIDSTTAAQLPTVAPTTLDLFRFTLNSDPKTAGDFTGVPRELRPGTGAVMSDTVNVFGLSTGVNNGDGNQASHWKDDAITGFTIGVMDPTLAFATSENPTEADYRAFDLIGYDLRPVPEPTTIALIVMGGAAALCLRRRSRAA